MCKSVYRFACHTVCPAVYSDFCMRMRELSIFDSSVRHFPTFGNLTTEYTCTYRMAYSIQWLRRKNKMCHREGSNVMFAFAYAGTEITFYLCIIVNIGNIVFILSL